jgi:hypothetical protein
MTGFFLYLALGQIVYGNGIITPNSAQERIVALRSVNKIFLESYGFAAILTLPINIRNVRILAQSCSLPLYWVVFFFTRSSFHLNKVLVGFQVSSLLCFISTDYRKKKETFY